MLQVHMNRTMVILIKFFLEFDELRVTTLPNRFPFPWNSLRCLRRTNANANVNSCWSSYDSRKRLKAIKYCHEKRINIDRRLRTGICYLFCPG